MAALAAASRVGVGVPAQPAASATATTTETRWKREAEMAKPMLERSKLEEARELAAQSAVKPLRQALRRLQVEALTYSALRASRRDLLAALQFVELAAAAAADMDADAAELLLQRELGPLPGAATG